MPELLNAEPQTTKAKPQAKAAYTPTAPVGTNVQFFPGGLPCKPEEEAEYERTDRLLAGTVVGWNHRPGDIRVLVYTRDGGTRLFRQVFHHEMAEARSLPPHPNVLNGGTWRYIPSDDSIKAQDWQRREEENQKKRRQEQLDHERAAAARKARLEEARLLESRR